MKRVLSVLIIPILLMAFTSCSVKEITPELMSTFTKKATVSFGDFSYSCEICRNEEGILSIRVLSTKALNMTMTYDGSNMHICYNNLEQDVSGNSMPSANIAVVLYDAYKSLLSDVDVQPAKIEGGYKYQGIMSLGDFILITDDNMLPSVFTMKQINLRVDFEQ